MRKLINLIAVTGLISTANIVNAQQKLGHINSEEILMNLPEAKEAQVTLQTLGKQKQAYIDGIIKEYQTKAAAIQAKEKTLSETNRESLTKELEKAYGEIQELGKRIEDTRNKASQDIAAKQSELLQPIQAKVAAAISSVSKDKSLAYVFNIANGQSGSDLVFWEGGEDITPIVKTKLGITTIKK
ncbi:OmpH family outer membrane protein [Chryseobacterium carnipullorum]|uniref:OmpH family outer membrane protein n=1 Tax=Chryseobacterium carnipullorum TaxID=1124835 RepID=A0A1M7JIY9_CHRCU|nr:OmpH family outer membrane protein [Chryseobacterium carnipullorum]AZA50669.1 OmpH family outer membrane protein [Chryseobacterium carnipullorum]SHM52928.1 periplasmic chaperone for outer membrane proteins Skp [Chryseobacterium carnipullorum]